MPALVNPTRHTSPATRRVYALSVQLVAAQRAKKIGARMRERRDELEMTQTEVAEKVGGQSVTKDYVSRWERGATEPSEAYLEQIAAALNTTVADLMAGPAAARDTATNGSTPDLFGVDNDDLPQLDRIEQKLDRLLAFTETIPVAGLGVPPAVPQPPASTARPSGRGRRRAASR